MEGKNTSFSPYSGFANNPILFVDPDGRDNFIYLIFVNPNKSKLSKSDMKEIIKRAQWIVTHAGLNVKIKGFEYNKKAPIDISKLDKTDRLVYIGDPDLINALKAKDKNETLDILKQNGSYGTSILGGQTAAVSTYPYSFEKEEDNAFNYANIHQDKSLYKKLKSMFGIVDKISHLARTAIHEATHTVVGGGHSNEGTDRYKGEPNNGNIMTNGSYPKEPYPLQLSPETMSFLKADRELLWQYYNVGDYNNETKTWPVKAEPTDNFSKKFKDGTEINTNK